MLRKSWIAIAALAVCAMSGSGADLPRLLHYRFDSRAYLRGSGKIMLDPEARHLDHGSLKIEHAAGAKTYAYDNFRVPAAPGDLCVRFNIRGAKEGKCTLTLNFNVKGGRNGSAGSAKFTVPIAAEWKLQEFRVALPADTAVIQFVYSFTGAENTVWLNDLCFGYAADRLAIPVTDTVGMKTPLNRPGWNPKAQIGGFYTYGTPAKNPPTVQLAATPQGLLVAFRNPWKPEKTACPANVRDANVWQDDCDEFFLFDPKTDRGWHFIVNANGAKYDSLLYQQQDGDPWKNNEKWNARGFRTLVSVGADSWEARLFVPWSDLGISLEEGLTLGINFASENKRERENSGWNLVGAYGEPNRFATMTLHDNVFTVTRARETEKISYTIKRAKPQFDALLQKGVPGGYTFTEGGQSYHKGGWPKALIAKIGDDAFLNWQEGYLKATAEAGMCGPSLPWVPNHLRKGITTLAELNKTCGLRFNYNISSSAHQRIASEKGAHFVLPRMPKRVSPIDPLLRAEITRSIRAIPRQRDYSVFKDTVCYIMGVDEPLNGYAEMFSTTLNTAHREALEETDRKIKERFGFGKYGLADEFGKHDAELPFRRIAFLRYFNQEYLEACREWRAALREVFPGVPYEMFCNNTCGGMASMDYALFDGEADALKVDPYPTSATYNSGFARGLYHTGFSTRVLRDLAPAAQTWVTLQGFIYCGGRPQPSDLREWTAQALKNGATRLVWYTQEAHLNLTDCLPEMFAIGSFVTKMERLKLPEKPRTAILFSNFDQFALRDGALHAAYSLYSILGEHLKSDFRFVSPTQLARGRAKLGDFKLLYVPKLAYTDPALTAELRKFVADGGTMVVFDPRFLAWNIDGTPASAARAELAGVASIAPRGPEKELSSAFGKLPLTPNANLELPTGRAVESYTPNGVSGKAIASYPDGTPAAVEKAYGKGKVIYFASQPFGNSSLALKPDNWLKFFGAMAKEVGEPTGLPIWDLTLPSERLRRPKLDLLQK